MTKINLLLFILLIGNINLNAQVNFIQTVNENDGGIKNIYLPKDYIYDEATNNFMVAGNGYLTLIQSDRYFKNAITTFNIQGTVNTSLENISTIKFSKNKKFFYVRADYQILVFERDLANQSFHKIQTFNSPDSLFYAGFNNNAISISEDGKNLYAISNNFGFHSVLVFSINESTGKIELKNLIKNGENGVDQLENLEFIKCSRDTQYIYIGTNLESNKTLQVFERASKKDSLTRLQILDQNDSLVTPWLIDESRDNKFVYVYDAEGIVMFSKDSLTRHLDFISKTRWANNSDFSSGTSMTISNDNRNLYISGASEIICFDRDILTGNLAYNESYKKENALSMVKEIKCVQNDSFLCILSSNSNSIVLYKRNPVDGKLSFYNQFYNGMNVVKGLTTNYELLVSNKGDKVFACSNAGESFITSFKINSIGFLSYAYILRNDSLMDKLPYRQPFCADISGDDQTIFVGLAYESLGISTIKVDPLTGRLIPLRFANKDSFGISSPGGSIISIKCTKDNKFLYAATRDSIFCFSIDPVSRNLEFSSLYTLESDGSKGLINILDIRLSSDNKNIYTVSGSAFSEWGLSVFSRDTISGEITFVENIKDYGIQVEKPRYTISSKDGKNVYAIGGKISSLARATDNGNLEFTANYPDTVLNTFDPFTSAAINDTGTCIIGISDTYSKLIVLHRFLQKDSVVFEHMYSSGSLEGINEPKQIRFIPNKNIFVVLSSGKISSYYFSSNFTDLNNVSADEKLIYPNPVSDYLNISLEADLSQIIEIVVYNTNGQQVLSTKISNDDLIFKLPVFNLTSGVYFVQLKGDKHNKIFKFSKI